MCKALLFAKSLFSVIKQLSATWDVLGERRWVTSDFRIRACTVEQKRKVYRQPHLTWKIPQKCVINMQWRLHSMTGMWSWPWRYQVFTDKKIKRKGIPDRASSISKGPDAWKCHVQELQDSLKWPQAPRREWSVTSDEAWGVRQGQVGKSLARQMEEFQLVPLSNDSLPSSCWRKTLKIPFKKECISFNYFFFTKWESIDH